MSETPSIADEELPTSAYDLIDYLERIYKPRCIGANETESSAHRYAGAVELVGSLVGWKNAELGVEDSSPDK